MEVEDDGEISKGLGAKAPKAEGAEELLAAEAEEISKAHCEGVGSALEGCS